MDLLPTYAAARKKSPLGKQPLSKRGAGERKDPSGKAGENFGKVFVKKDKKAVIPPIPSRWPRVIL